MSEPTAEQAHTYDHRDDAGPWVHAEDGSPCPTFWADLPTANGGEQWWCTEHQQYLASVNVAPGVDPRLSCHGCSAYQGRRAIAQAGYAHAALNEHQRQDLRDRLRVGFEVPLEQRAIADTWLYVAAVAEQWYVDRTHLPTPPASTPEEGRR